VRNLLSLGGEPVIVDDLALPAARFPGLTERQFAGRPSTIYNLYQEAFGLSVVRTSERLRATLADADTAALPPRRPRRAAARDPPRRALYNDDPVELRISLVNTAHHEYWSDIGTPRLKPPVGAQGHCVLPHCRHRSLRVMFGHRADGTARQSQCDVRISCRDRFADATRRTLQFLRRRPASEASTRRLTRCRASRDARPSHLRNLRRRLRRHPATAHPSAVFTELLTRHERPLLVILGAATALAAMLAMTTLQRPARPITQSDIDAAVLHTLETKDLPSQAARAFDRIAGSVVRVRDLADADDDSVVESGVGTGVVIVDNGLILTNLHVVLGAKKIGVVFADGLESEASVVSVQPEHDLAVLKAKTLPDDLKAATLRSTSDLLPGDRVIAVGFPFGIGPSVSEGVISGLRREYSSPKASGS